MINVHCGAMEIEITHDRIKVNGEPFTMDDLTRIFSEELGGNPAVELVGRCGDNHFCLVTRLDNEEEIYHEIVVELKNDASPFEYIGKTVKPLERTA